MLRGNLKKTLVRGLAAGFILILAVLIFYGFRTGKLKLRADVTGTVDAINNDADTSIGEVPPGVVGRKFDNLVADFEDLNGWKVNLTNVNAKLIRSRVKQLQGDYVAKLSYSAAAKDGIFELIPPNPIALPEKFDSINLWGSGYSYREEQTGEIAPIVTLKIQDGTGNIKDIALPKIHSKNWQLFHTKINQEIAAPAKIVSININWLQADKSLTFYLDALSAYSENQSAINFNLPSGLPFPTKSDTILSSIKTADYQNRVYKNGDDYVFEYQDSSNLIQYIYKPTNGTLSDLSTKFNNNIFQTNNGGGATIELAGKTFPPKDGALQRELVSVQLAGDKVEAKWRFSYGSDQTEIQYIFSVKQKSLMIEAKSDEAKVIKFSLGTSANTPNPKLVPVPFLKIRGGLINILYSNNLFVSSIIDYYQTNSSYFASTSKILSDSAATYNDGSYYFPKTDGQKNLLNEKVFVTVSDDFQETLPNIPNPKSPYGQLIGKKAYTHIIAPTNNPNRLNIWLDLWKSYKQYGIDELMLRYYASFWSKGGTVSDEPWVQTLTTASDLGDEAAIDHLKKVKELGYLVGLYLNYYLAQPINSNWNENNIQLDADGQWRTSWNYMYALKPLAALKLQIQYSYSSAIHQKFGTDFAYLDLITSGVPIEDYDARAPEAGKFSSSFAAQTKILLNEKNYTGGPVISEGGYHWMMAGLEDGSYGQIAGYNLLIQPYLLDFDLLKIHPLEVNFGVNIADTTAENYPDKILAASIAYGHNLWIAPDLGLEKAIKSYYLMQQLQERYAMQEVSEIKYNADGKLVGTSEAIAKDAYLKNQVYIKYKNNLEIYVNGNLNENWKITAAGKNYELPPYGWLALMPKKLAEYSALIGGKKADYINSPIYLYVDGRGQMTDFGKVKTDRALIFRKDKGDYLLLIPSGQIENDDNKVEASFTVMPGWKGIAKIAAYDRENRYVKDIDFTLTSGGRAQFNLAKSDEVFAYRIEKTTSESSVDSSVIDEPSEETVSPEPSEEEIPSGTESTAESTNLESQPSQPVPSVVESLWQPIVAAGSTPKSKIGLVFAVLVFLTLTIYIVRGVIKNKDN